MGENRTRAAPPTSKPERRMRPSMPVRSPLNETGLPSALLDSPAKPQRKTGFAEESAPRQRAYSPTGKPGQQNGAAERTARQPQRDHSGKPALQESPPCRRADSSAESMLPDKRAAGRQPYEATAECPPCRRARFSTGGPSLRQRVRSPTGEPTPRQPARDRSSRGSARDRPW